MTKAIEDVDSMDWSKAEASHADDTDYIQREIKDSGGIEMFNRRVREVVCERLAFYDARLQRGGFVPCSDLERGRANLVEHNQLLREELTRLKLHEEELKASLADVARRSDEALRRMDKA